MAEVDFNSSDRDLHFRGDGSASRDIKWGRQDVGGNEDTIGVDVPEHNFRVDGKRIAVEVDTIAELATLDTTNLDGRLVRVKGGATLGDGKGGDYLYYDTGKSGAGTIDGTIKVAGDSSDNYYLRIAANFSSDKAETKEVATVATLPSEPEVSTYFVETNRLYYVYQDGSWTTDRKSTVDTDTQWKAMTEMLDNQIVYHTGRSASYRYNASINSWAYHSGNISSSAKAPYTQLTKRLAHYADKRAGGVFSRIVDGKARLVDHSRTGTPRQVQPGRCYKFDGSADFVTVGDYLNAPTSLTVMAWVRPASTSLERITGRRFTPNDGWYLQTNSSQAAFVIDDGTTETVVAGGVISSNTWHHVAATYDGATIRVYVDGVQVATGSSATPASTADSLIWGETGGGFFEGCMFDMRASTEVYTAEEIAEIAAMGLDSTSVGKAPNVCWYKGDEGAGTIAYDSSGNGNDGTITASSLTTFHDETTNDVYSFQNEVGAFQIANLENTSGGMMTTPLNTAVDSVKFWMKTEDTRYILFSHSTDGGRYFLGEDTTPGVFIHANSGTPVVKVDGVVTTDAADLRDGEWHEIEVTGLDLSSWSGDFKLGYQGSTYAMQAQLYDLRLYSGSSLVHRYFTGLRSTDDQVGDAHGTLITTPTALWRTMLPRDESTPTQDVLGNALTYSGQAPNDAVLSSPCLTLNGTSEYVTLGSTLGSPSTYEIECYIKRDTVSAQESIIDTRDANDDGVFFGLTSAGELLVRHGTSDITSTAEVDDNEWHHVKVVWDGTTVEIYIDDVLDTSSSVSSSVSTSTNMRVGSANYTAANFFGGSIFGVKIKSDSSTIVDLPLTTESDYSDVSGDQNHGTPTIVSEATAWANTQDKVDTLVKDGFLKATQYDGTDDYFDKGGRLTSGAMTKLSGSAWVYATSDPNATTVMGEYEVGGSLGWVLRFSGTSTINLGITQTGSSLSNAQIVVSDVQNKWVHIAFTYNAGETKIYLDGVEVLDTTIATSIFDSASSFAIGAKAASSGSEEFEGSISQVVVDQDVEWSAAQVQAIMNGSVPSSAWYFRDGNGKEFNKDLADLTQNSTPVTHLVPKGAGPPVTVGPGVLADGQSLDLTGGEADSPFAQKLTDLIADTTYDAGDGSESPEFFARDRDTDDGDDRIQLFEAALTGDELTNLTDDVS